MLVEKLMTPDAESCHADANVAEAAAIMWRRDCGAVPVVDEGGRVVGIITDRDICMALSMRGQRAGEVRVGEVMAGGVRTCSPVDDVRDALELMRAGQLRRLPVVDAKERLVGILSINDIIRHTHKGKGKKHVSRRQTLATLRAICRPHGSAEPEEENKDTETEGEVHFNEIVLITEDEAQSEVTNEAPVEQISDARVEENETETRAEAVEAGAQVADGGAGGQSEAGEQPTTTKRRRRRRTS